MVMTNRKQLSSQIDAYLKSLREQGKLEGIYTVRNLLKKNLKKDYSCSMYPTSCKMNLHKFEFFCR